MNNRREKINDKSIRAFERKNFKQHNSKSLIKKITNFKKWWVEKEDTIEQRIKWIILANICDKKYLWWKIWLNNQWK